MSQFNKRRMTAWSVCALVGLVLMLAGCPWFLPRDAQIEVTITGVPEGADAKVTVSGPGGTFDVTSSTTLSVTVGAYSISVEPVDSVHGIVGDRYTGVSDVDSITVAQGDQGEVNISYAFAYSGFMLAPDYGNDVVGVVTQSDLESGDGPSAEWYAEDFGGYIGVALGPDGRLYVLSYDQEAILVVDLADATTDGSITPVLVLTSDDMEGPAGLAFDQQGHLWVGEYSSERVLKFNDVTALTEDTHQDADVVLYVDTSEGAEDFWEIYDIFIDHNNNLWVADYDERIYRFEDIETYSGETEQVPALCMTYFYDEDAGEYSIYYPMSLIVDKEDRLYVGNYDYYVSRFDNASSLIGNRDDVPAAAYIYTGYDYPYMVTLDQSGALWTAHYYGELTRILEPETLTGNVEPELDIDGDWSDDGGPDGGRIIFVPTPNTVFGY